jgi:T4 superinfection immunity protein
MYTTLASQAASSGASSAGGAIALVVVGLVIYFTPLIIAAVRHVPHVGSVGVINAFLGWTLVGWVAALAMACRSNTSTTVQVTNVQQQVPPQEPGRDVIPSR